MNIGEKLKRARVEANITQEALAEMLAVSRQTISNWENGRSYPDIASIIVLSDVYNITLDSLLKGDEDIIKHLSYNRFVVLYAIISPNEPPIRSNSFFGISSSSGH